MPKVLISDKMSERAAEIFKARGIEVDVKPGMSPDELKAVIGDYDGLAIRSATKVTPEVIEAAGKLKVIGRAGIGVDNIDLPSATAKGIVVMNTPFGNSITTAEHAVALMFALARQLPEADRSTQAGKWEKSRFMGVELTGKTLGIIGCGNIGAIVAERAIGLKMKVIAFDPFLAPDRARELGVEKVELDELYRRADFITLHTPLTDATRHMIDAAAIAKMKPGVRIINCARGGLVVEPIDRNISPCCRQSQCGRLADALLRARDDRAPADQRCGRKRHRNFLPLRVIYDQNAGQPRTCNPWNASGMCVVLAVRKPSATNSGARPCLRPRSPICPPPSWRGSFARSSSQRPRRCTPPWTARARHRRCSTAL